MKLTQERQDRDQQAITYYGNAVAKVKANIARSIQRKKATKKANKEYFLQYVASLAENMLSIDQDDELDDVESLADPP